MPRTCLGIVIWEPTLSAAACMYHKTLNVSICLHFHNFFFTEQWNAQIYCNYWHTIFLYGQVILIRKKPSNFSLRVKVGFFSVNAQRHCKRNGNIFVMLGRASSKMTIQAIETCTGSNCPFPWRKPSCLEGSEGRKLCELQSCPYTECPFQQNQCSQALGHNGAHKQQNPALPPVRSKLE